MDELFKISKFGAEDAERIAASPNEPHVHEFEELIIGTEGSLEHFIDFKATHTLTPCVSFITKGKLHRIKPLLHHGKCNFWVIRFKTEFIPGTTFQLYASYHDEADVKMREGACFDRMVTLCQMMHDEMHQPNPKLSIVRHLLNALFEMIEAEKEKCADYNQLYPDTQNTTFQNFLKILEENFRRPMGVEFYAEKLFMSSRNLNLLCQNVLNKSVSEIIETRKLTEAMNLLIHSDKSISEIGYELGYNEKAYFTNVFKKKNGITPTTFREEMRNIIS
jgi:AraC-like DNA-binding protein